MSSDGRILQWRKKKEHLSSPPLKNHTTTLVDTKLYIFGGYDGRKNYSSVQVFDTETLQWIPTHFGGRPPESRNGHTATLVNRHIYIIGGWIESGPSAGNDVHCLDIDNLCWIPTPQSSRAPICNMHTSDYIPDLNAILVFRGGDGREYLNDMHMLDIATQDWVDLEIDGTPPTKRANHSSARVNSFLFIFGGWNGRERLNDLYILDTGPLPHLPVHSHPFPAFCDTTQLTSAGANRFVKDFLLSPELIFLFGGNGPSSQRYDDLRILTPQETDTDRESRESIVPRTLLWKVCLGEGEEPLLETLSYETAGASMQDGEPSMSMQSLSSSSGCLCCTSVATTTHTATAPVADPRHTHSDRRDRFHPQLCTNCNSCLLSVYGHGPGKRAGHTATAVGRRIFFIGGGFGSEYVQTIHILDTDAPPEPTIRSEPLTLRIQSQLKTLFNSEELSDVIFLFSGDRVGEQKRIFGHRILLSLMCDRFRAMFSNGYRESFQLEIPLIDTDYLSFLSLMEYFYTGEAPSLLKSYLDKISDAEAMNETVSFFAESQQCGEEDEDLDEDGVPLTLLRLLNLLDIADEYLCGPSQGHLKELCEVVLSKMITPQSAEYLLSRAERSNAFQLRDACLHFLRSLDDDVTVTG